MNRSTRYAIAELRVGAGNSAVAGESPAPANETATRPGEVMRRVLGIRRSPTTGAELAAATRVNRKREQGGVDGLGIYLDAAGSYALLGAEEERRLTRQLVRLRGERWLAATADREHADDLVDAARQQENGAASRALALWRDDRCKQASAVAALLAADANGRLLEHIERCNAGEHSGWGRALARARASYMRARDRFVCANLRLVVALVQRIGGTRMSLADRIQEGNVGLLAAVERFDPERGCRFSTYAAWWIRYAVTRAVMKHGRTVRIPTHIHMLFTKARRTGVAMQIEIGRTPSPAEIAERIGTPVAKIESAFAAMDLHAVGFDEPLTQRNGATAGEVLRDESFDDWTERIGERIDARLVGLLAETLDSVDGDIVRHRFGIGGAPKRTLGSIGADYGLSYERIRQLQNAALLVLRAVVERSSIPSLALSKPPGGVHRAAC
jgi:RNA polymerase sigma factor (sigma-70 family)